MRRLDRVLLVLVCIAVLPVAAARADFTSATLLSGTRQFQFTEAQAPAFSEDGRYVVFQGTIGAISGVFRRDLQTGAVAPVATTYVAESSEDAGERLGAPSPSLNAPDAAGPSVSADGRYVAFTTTADLSPNEEPSADESDPEVYVRDMDKQPAEEGAYTLASAGIVFYGCHSLCGAQAAAGVALSADGRHVVFTVLSESNLDHGMPTPPSQVAMRDLENDTTTLVSVTPPEGHEEGHATPGGGAYPSTDVEAHNINSASSEQGGVGDQVTASSAAISADGTTVAWLGTNLAEQVPEDTEELGESGDEVEPLWRRVADGTSATTTRLLGDAGLDLRYFLAQTEPQEAIRCGSLVALNNRAEFVPPVLSADGRTVAVLANAPPFASEKTAEFNPTSVDSDAYVVHVPSSTSQPIVTSITTTPNYDAGAGATGDVVDLAISPDGTHLAFETTRTQIVSPSLELLSPPIAYTGIFTTYVVNLELGTLQQVTGTYDGSQPDHSAGLLSFSGSGQSLAFSSSATNLFFGDAVDKAEVYAVQEASSSPEVAPSVLQLPPAGVLPVPQWLLSATAEAEPNGEVLIDAEVPGAGRLGVSAIAQLPRRAHIPRKRAQASHASHKSSAVTSRRKPKPTTRVRRGATLVSQTIARATMLAGSSAELNVHLHALSPYGSLVASKTGLYALIRVTFTAPGHPALVQQIPVTFRHVIESGRKSKRAKKPQ